MTQKTFDAQAVKDLVQGSRLRAKEQKEAKAAETGDGLGEDPRPAEDEEFGEVDLEMQAEMALALLRPGSKRETKVTGSVPGSGPTPKKKAAKSAAAINNKVEKIEKEEVELLNKFKDGTLKSGPLANKLKSLKKTCDEAIDSVSGRDDEASVKLSSVANSLIEAGDLIAGLLSVYTQTKTALGATSKLQGNMEKQCVNEFQHLVLQLLETDRMKASAPFAYVELFLKIRAWRAIIEHAGLDEAVELGKLKDLTGFSTEDSRVVQKKLDWQAYD